MNLIVKIVIAVAVAAVATAITTRFAVANHAALVLFAAFCGATVITTLLVSLPGRPAATSARPERGGKPRSGKPRKAATASAAGDSPREQGKVKWFNVSKGFGFIIRDNGEEIFVHFRSIRGGGRRGLRDGQTVTFVVTDSDKGPQAEDVEGID